MFLLLGALKKHTGKKIEEKKKREDTEIDGAYQKA